MASTRRALASMTARESLPILTAMTPCVVSSEVTERSNQTLLVASSLMASERSPIFLVIEAARSWTIRGTTPAGSGWKFLSEVALKKAVGRPSVPER